MPASSDTSPRPDDHVIVLFGATGDLAPDSQTETMVALRAEVDN